MDTKSILVVDDFRVNLHMLRHILRKQGYAVSMANDGAQALAKLQSAAVDLVISDINMPVMDGLQLVAAMREDAMLSDTPIVLLTASGEDETHGEAQALGVDAFVTQPFDSAELLATVASLL